METKPIGFLDRSLNKEQEPKKNKSEEKKSKVGFLGEPDGEEDETPSSGTFPFFNPFWWLPSPRTDDKDSRDEKSTPDENPVSK